MSDVVFAVSGLTKRYGSRNIFHSLDLTIARGEAVFVLGRNGAGKSTLLHCLAGLEPFEGGEIRVTLSPDLRSTISPSSTLPTIMRRKIGIVFQNAGRSLWPHRTVLRNVADPLLLQDMIDPEEVARTYLEKLGIGQRYFDMHPEQLSGGEQQRVAIARTLAADPKVLLLDEVTDHLDPLGVETLLRNLKEYVKSEEKTLIVVTHWTDLLTRWDGGVVVIGDGEAKVYPSSYAFLDTPPPEVGDLVREVTPGSHELLCGRRSLEAAAEVMATALHSDRVTEFPQSLVELVANLLTAIDPEDSHLVLLVLREQEGEDALVVRGAFASKAFALDGKHVETGLGEAVREVRLAHNGGSVGHLEVAVDILRNSRRGISFGSNGPGGIISMMFDPDKRKHFYYDKFVPGHPIGGVYALHVRDMNPTEKASYYEFSKRTQMVWLFAMEWEGEVVGVLSIDSYGEEPWLPFVVKNLKAIASMGAMWMVARRPSEGDQILQGAAGTE